MLWPSPIPRVPSSPIPCSPGGSGCKLAPTPPVTPFCVTHVPGIPSAVGDITGNTLEISGDDLLCSLWSQQAGKPCYYCLMSWACATSCFQRRPEPLWPVEEVASAGPGQSPGSFPWVLWPSRVDVAHRGSQGWLVARVPVTTTPDLGLGALFLLRG